MGARATAGGVREPTPSPGQAPGPPAPPQAASTGTQQHPTGRHRGGRRAVALLGAALAAVLVGGAVVAGRSTGMGADAGSAPSGSAAVPYVQPAASAAVGLGGGANAEPGTSGPVEFGLAEPSGSLPGVEDSTDLAAWSQIRADVEGTGSCWLRSDLDSWLAGAIDALAWLGSPTPCPTGSGLPPAGTSVKVLAILDQQTIWAARRLCPDAPFSTTWRVRHMDFTLDDWRLLVGCVARRFAGRISAYEIWNEPLLSNSMLGYEDGTAAHYLDLLRVADAEIKAADPAAAVIALGGSDLYAGGDTSRLATMRAFSTQLIALGAANYADAISLHAYPWGREDASVWTSYLAELRLEQAAWAKPVWITETGQRASDGSQSAYVDAAYGLFVEVGVRNIFWFSITDQRDGDFGMRGRPVTAALREFALAHEANLAGAPSSAP